MTETPDSLSIIAGASTVTDPQEAVTGNTLIVVEYPGEEPRIYWRGVRLNGTIDYTQPMAKGSHFTMLIDGERVVFGTGDIYNPTFEFRGETLHVLPAAGRVNYDAEADRPVF
jgi:hypothetical protein